MRLEKIATHTVDLDLFKGGIVIDAGCRDFDFANAIAPMVERVYAFDPAPDVVNASDCRNIEFFNRAFVGIGHEGSRTLVVAGNGSRLTPDGEHSTWGHSFLTFPFTHRSDCSRGFDCVKLDIEGSEYDVLLTWPGPVASQITVEYHEHTQQGRAKHGENVYERIAQRLGQWYTLVQDDPMDTLWILK